jgi:amidohydrolase
MRSLLTLTTGLALVLAQPAFAQQQATPVLAERQNAAHDDVNRRIAAINHRVIAWRRDIHQHPELGLRESRTAGLIARHLRQLGLDEVRTGQAQTGVVGILRGRHPGRTIALRADMDALPILEATGLPFASRAATAIDGASVPIMHACGHDAHVAMLMGAAEILSSMREQLHGTVVFVFQPNEEGVAWGEQGAILLLREGALSRPRPDAIFGLHVEPGRVGAIDVRSGPFLSSATSFRIRLTGRQTHAGRPWEGTDTINMTADVIQSLNRIAARQVNVFDVPNVVSVGSVQAGNRGNIIPGTSLLIGTIRTYSAARKEELKQAIERALAGIAQSYGASAQVEFADDALVTENNPDLLRRLTPALTAAAAPGGLNLNARLRGAAEDFSFYLADIPGVYAILGSTPNFTTMENAPTNHSDRFDIDENVLAVGVRAHVFAALTYLDGTP